MFIYLENKVGALCSVILTNYRLGDQVKKTGMGRTCSTYGGRVKVHTGV